MKKCLLTAGVVAGLLLPTLARAAEPIELEIGGWLGRWIGVAQQDDDWQEQNNLSLNTVDLMADGSLSFEGSTTLDSGLEVSTFVSMMAGTRLQNDQIDQAHVTVSSRWGILNMGSNSNAETMLNVSPQDTGLLFLNESTAIDYVMVPDEVDRLDATFINLDNDADKITWVTPEYAGFSAGVSWVPGPEQDVTGEDQSLEQGVFEEGYVLALRGERPVGPVGLMGSLGYANYNVGGRKRRTAWSTGLKATWGEFSLAGGFKSVSDPAYVADTPAGLSAVTDGDNTAPADGGAQDGYVWNAGLAWQRDRVAVTLSCIRSVVEGELDNPANPADPRNNEDISELGLLSGSYKLAPGVDVFSTLALGRADDERETLGGRKVDNSAWALVSGLSFVF